MKKLFLGIMMASVLMACNQTGKTNNTTTGTAGAANVPIIKFENESHDFGKIKQGDKVSYSFKFTNTGKSPLIITNAVASCGCTTPQWPKTPVLPGNTGAISVTFNSAGKSGLQDKQITVTANTNPAQSMVHLIGEVLTK
ncbi:DUF1573 domain-containing protein [Mucilaginibacter sp.]|uniref:DUF1573 domain-containing protein n=1 Tax=Mucilaginibacter sp. TaxID=1882438 RepID=UPI002611DE70|nr:DUF1573 domain-containing protein [Mucilaginibacter sp.]MDB4925304.1 hypothetical protein [Mucilaginibacter sp.]